MERLTQFLGIENLISIMRAYTCSGYYQRSISGVKVSINGAFYRTGGGVFDSMIESYHQGLRLPNGARGRTPENRYNVSGISQSGEKYNIQSSDFGFIDPQFTISIPLSQDAASGNYFIDLSSTMPLSLGQLSYELPELKANLVFESIRENGIAYSVGLSGLVHADRNENGLNYLPFSTGAFASVQAGISNNLAIISQAVLSSSLERNFPGFYEYTFYLDFGFRYLIEKNRTIEFIVRENPSPGKGTVDVSGFARISF